jgi:asparaginyl-tRNA synthetase
MKTHHTRIKSLLTTGKPGQDITVKGWVRSRRGNKHVQFIALNDGSCLSTIQVVVDLEKFDAESLKNITTGACIRATGLLAESPARGQSVEIQAHDLEVYGSADPEVYPLQKKGHSLEFLREIAHLRPRTNTFGSVLRIRNTMAAAIHSFFQHRGFVWLHTPIITGSDCEGAGEMFRVTTLDPKDPPLNDQGEIDFSQDFFGRETALTVSGQLEGELGAMALGEIYTFGPTFRAENSNTARHLAEFWMVEPEMAFYELNDNMDLAEDFLKFLVQTALDESTDDLEFLSSLYDPGLLQRLRSTLDCAFERLTYSEAIKLLEKSNKKFEFPSSWGADLQSEHERYLVEETFKRPVILTDYPATIKPFYMKTNSDGLTVRAMDVLFPKIGEIIGGSQREDNHARLLQRINNMDIPEKDVWWYLETRLFGSAPHSGFGLGFERLMLFITGMANIRDVIPFPRTPKNASF